MVAGLDMIELTTLGERLWLLQILLLMLWLLLRLRRQSLQPGNLPYGRGPALLTPTQLTFLQTLEQAAGRGYLIFVRMRLIDLVSINAGLDAQASRQARERILNKRFDFVLCERSSREAVAVIELEDGGSGAARRNDWTAQLCAKIGLKLLRFDVQRGYSLGDLRQQLGLGRDTAEVLPAPVAARGVARLSLLPPVAQPAPAVAANRDATAPLCPQCAGRMVVRQASQGVRAGVLLWACCQPSCAGEVSFDQWLAS